jgi:thiol:disulfide interchange protein DsbD
MRRIGPVLTAWTLLAVLTGPVHLAQGQLPSLGRPIAPALPDVTLKAAASTTTVRPGQSFHLVVDLTVRDGLWLYSTTPRGTLTQPEPLRVHVDAGDWRTGEPRYPRPDWHTISTAGLTDSNLVYDGSVKVYVPVTADPAPASGTQSIRVRVTGQTCDDRGCYQVDEQAQTPVTIGVPADDAAPPIPPDVRTAAHWDALLAHQPNEPSRSGTVAGGLPGANMATWAALALAFAAGIVLNVMPCVLPVVPIKIMSIIQQARQSRRRSITLGLAYAGGILVFFVAMGVISVAVRLATGAAFSLNEPFGHPGFLIGMSLLLVRRALRRAMSARWRWDLSPPYWPPPAAGRSWSPFSVGPKASPRGLGAPSSPCSVSAWAAPMPCWPRSLPCSSGCRPQGSGWNGSSSPWA